MSSTHLLPTCSGDVLRGEESFPSPLECVQSRLLLSRVNVLADTRIELWSSNIGFVDTERLGKWSGMVHGKKRESVETIDI